MLRTSLFAIVFGTSLISCAKKDAAAPPTVTADQAMAGRGTPSEDTKEAKAADPRGVAVPMTMPAKPTATPPAPPHAAGAGLASSADSGRAAKAEYADAPVVSANVAAGEWDDNANYRDYAKWLAGERPGIARLDVSGRSFLVVTDRAGKPVPNCSITIAGNQHTASLVTMASGRAILFPKSLGLSGQLTATASCEQATAKGTVDLQTVDAVTKLVLSTDRTLAARRPVDLAFVLDTTGSMGEEIEAVKQTIRAVASKLQNGQTDVRIGLVEYKDRIDQQVTRTFPFSSDLAKFSASVAALTAGGGGDTPEDMQAGLSVALDQLQWRSDAVVRMVVVIADAPPHLDYQDEKDYADAARRASARGIKLFTVSASGMDDTGQIVMRQMAQYTGATNMFVLRGGAGPQSVGGGDPKSSCGTTHDNYTSGNLDQLITDKVKRELASLDGNPMAIAGLGQDEKSKPCSERIAIAH